MTDEELMNKLLDGDEITAVWIEEDAMTSDNDKVWLSRDMRPPGPSARAYIAFRGVDYVQNVLEGAAQETANQVLQGFFHWLDKIEQQEAKERGDA